MNVTAFFGKLKNHFANWREWELNPVVVKELRQSVRSWAVTGMLLLFLAVLFCTALVFLITQSFETNVSQTLGATVFMTFLVILTGASLLFIPIYVGSRLAGERQESNMDLLYVTSLTPQQIIRGKFLCGAYMAVLFFSACMPFMVFTNLLRGIDLPTIFFILGCLFVTLCVAIQVAIFLACLPISKALKILVAMFGLIGMIGTIGSLVGAFVFMTGSGIGSTMFTRDFWVAFGMEGSLLLAGMFLLYLLSVALISPQSANRALPLRRYLTSIWVLGAVACAILVWFRNDPRLMLPWAWYSYSILIPAIVVIISNKDELSLRVRRQIPTNRAKRALAFLFFNGAAGGLLWVGLLLGATFGITVALQHLPHGSMPLPDELYDSELSTAALLLYSFAYAGTALFLHRRFMGARSPKIAGILAVILPGVWALVPYIFFFLVNRLSWRTVEGCHLGNIFNVFVVRDSTQKFWHVVCGTIWLLVVLVLNRGWFVRQAKSFRPPEPEPPLIGVAPIPASSAAGSVAQTPG